jgi:cellulose synthase (UDP-forming)
LGGVVTAAFYFSWWFEEGRLSSPLLAGAFALGVFYQLPQTLGAWIVYLAGRSGAAAGSPPPGSSVDVFVTACGEPYVLVQRALEAAVRLRGNHRTHLLDDGNDAALFRLAESLGVTYLCRADRRQAKAGNVNAALARTRGDVIVIFDVDHVPAPDFLERTLGHFSDPRVGFVQVMLTFDNAEQSWLASAAVDASLDFYNPTSIGMDRLGGASLMGSNALIRRTALESIGGYQPGLAEDLGTSLALHAAGWRSAYVAEPLAPGLAPPDAKGWFTQQLKWSRGVFEVFLTTYLSKLAHLGWGQRLSYAVRCSYYLCGVVILVHLGLLVYGLLFGSPAFRHGLHDYLFHSAPLAVAFLGIRKIARSVHRHPKTPTRVEWRAVLLVYATWPTYTLAWIMALLRIPLGFRRTPKTMARSLRAGWLAPQILSLAVLVAGIAGTLWQRGGQPPLLLSAGLVQAAMLLVFLSLVGRPGARTRLRVARVEPTPASDASSGEYLGPRPHGQAELSRRAV